MGAAKFAISVPAETMKQVDRAAKRLKPTRSGYVAIVLARIARRERDAMLSKRIDGVLAELEGRPGSCLGRAPACGPPRAGHGVVIQRGDVVRVSLPESGGSAPRRRRPALVLQHDRFNSTRIATAVVVAITSKLKYAARR